MSTYIKSISTNAGFLEESPVEFDRGLTCIIGARGTCKSTLVESIRFAFDCNPAKISVLLDEGDCKGEPSCGLIKATLGAGSVQCQVHSQTGDELFRFTLDREVGADLRIYQDGVREHSSSDILHKIEIYSQGDLQRIAEVNSLRIALIDRPNAGKIIKLSKERKDCAEQLFKLGSDIRTLRVQISTLKQELQPEKTIREELQQTEEKCPKLSPELEVNRALFEKRSMIIESLNTVASMQSEVISILAPVNNYIVRFANASNVVAQQEQRETNKVLALIQNIEVALRKIGQSTAELQSYDLQTAIATLKKVFDEKNDIFYKLRQEQQTVNEFLKKQQNLRRQIEHMEKIAKELESASNKATALIRERDDVRAKIARIDNEIFDLRIKEIDSINKEHSDSVYLTLTSDSISKGYQALLSYMLGGSRIRAQEEVAAVLAKTFSPSALIDIVESGSGQNFADVLGRDLGQMNRVVSHLLDHPDLYKLESEEPAAQLDISMYDDGQPKAVETLSKGQKATALLPLILRPLPYPLLFDQPEDDLDNSFINRFLVKAIHDLKKKRQLIFVTHNANIPVIGEADKVIVMSMKNPRAAKPPKIGTVDERKQEILDLLEGGAEAFKAREARYGELLNH
jgi:DNA repair ATPase RecN